MRKTYFNWSTGKDSSLALFKVLNEGIYEVSKLVTTVNGDYDRVSMHGLRTALLEQQAEALGLPLFKISLSGDISMKAYDAKMKEVMSALTNEGYEYGIFGDIFLEDLKKYREEKLAEVGVKGVFPLWKRDTRVLLEEFLDLGFKAITVCTNAKYLDDSFCGRVLDHDFIKDLPANVDVCGENGEFHTFVFDGPIFSRPIPFDIGEKVQRGYTPSGNDDDDCFSKDASWDTSFWYCDLLPKKG
ncbi:Dph6-related ATP pyrophosphatase [Spongiimicrobium salis]|uniref:Dph6-related ATP pyrophosphatase n=1 Tax=Spongiimicrobium salis TaxID=1667022 RepID=UPI00374DD261